MSHFGQNSPHKLYLHTNLLTCFVGPAFSMAKYRDPVFHPFVHPFIRPLILQHLRQPYQYLTSAFISWFTDFVTLHRLNLKDFAPSQVQHSLWWNSCYYLYLCIYFLIFSTVRAIVFKTKRAQLYLQCFTLCTVFQSCVVQ